MCESYIFAGFTPQGGRILAHQGPGADLVCLLEELDLSLDEEG